MAQLAEENKRLYQLLEYAIQELEKANQERPKNIYCQIWEILPGIALHKDGKTM